MTDRSLPTPLRDLLSENLSEERQQRLWLGVASRRSFSLRTFRSRLFVAAACAVVALALGAIWHISPRVPAVATLSNSEIPSSVSAKKTPLTQDFGAGAQVTVEPGTTLDVLDFSSRFVLLALRRGTARFDIRPGGARSWHIECGGVGVEVVGTAFDVERSARSLRVAVQRGKVLVRGVGVPDAVQALEAGMQLTIEYPYHLVDERPATAVTDNSPAPVESIPSAPRAVSRAPAVTASAEWQDAATRKDWQHAWAALGADGLARQAARSDDISELLSLADVARLSGHPAQSVMPLEQIVRAHAGDPRAALAAFTLGKVFIEQLGRAPEAAAAFEKAILLKLPGALAEDAQVRLVEAYSRAHNLALARAAADDYRRRFPTGRRIADVERWSSTE